MNVTYTQTQTPTCCRLKLVCCVIVHASRCMCADLPYAVHILYYGVYVHAGKPAVSSRYPGTPCSAPPHEFPWFRPRNCQSCPRLLPSCPTHHRNQKSLSTVGSLGEQGVGLHSRIPVRTMHVMYVCESP
jgi:hypothetical protein